MPAQFSAFEIEDEVLPNLREYALANSLFWALAEGHACEQSARQNAMDVSSILLNTTRTSADVAFRTPPRTPET